VRNFLREFRIFSSISRSRKIYPVPPALSTEMANFFNPDFKKHASDLVMDASEQSGRPAGSFIAFVIN